MNNVEVLYPVIAGVIWSTNPAIIHRFARRAPPALFTAIRAIMAVSFIGLLVALNGGIHLNDYSSTIIFLLLFSGALGPGIGDIAYTRSIQILGGSLAVVISYTYIFFAQFFSAFIFGEKVTYITVIGGLLAFAGIVIASTNNSSGNSISKNGLIYGFIAALCWGLASSLIGPLRNYVDAYSTAFIRTSVVVIFSLLMSLMLGESLEVTKGLLVAAFFTGVFGWGVGMVLFVYSIYTIGVSATVVVTALTPVLAQFTSRLVAGEKISPRIFLGALLVAVSIALQAI